METATLSCTYKVVAKILPVGRDDYVAEGHFVYPNFSFVSGDSSWEDTLRVNETRSHQVVVRALARGDWLVDASVKSVIEENIMAISGSGSVELHVR